VFVGDDPEAELKALAAAAERLQPRVALWLLFREATRTTSYGLVAQARSFLAPFTPGARFGGGTDGFFVDLNRQRPSAAEFDQVSFAWSPQVHLPDDETIAENQASLPWIAESARAFVGTCPLALSPVTLEPRPAAARPAEPAPADPRLHARFGAAWAAAFLAAAAQGGFASLTLLEPAGARGVVCDGKGTPLYHVLADVADFGGGVVVEAAAEGKAGLGALVLRREAQLRTLVWNLRGSPGRARVLGLGRSARIQRLGESEQGDATAAPAAFRSRPAEVMRPGRDGYDLLLGPHEVVRLDTVHAD
jgi:hypothetical protein